MGYLETGEVKHAGPDVIVDMIIMEKRTSSDGHT